jgi:DNA-binding beta-propeller fold protein YncE
MKPRIKARINLIVAIILLCIVHLNTGWNESVKEDSWTKAPALNGRYLFVAVPGIRDYLGYGGHGLLVFDITNGHKFVKRISTQGLHPNGLPSNVKGIAASMQLNSIYITTWESLQRIDIGTGKLVWEKLIPGGCDRLAVSPDGKTIYLPAFEGQTWTVLDAKTGDVIKQLDGFNKSHNTVYGLSGKRVYLSDIANTVVKVADAQTNQIVSQIGPFSAPVRPFTINGAETTIYVNCNDLLGFEVGDLKTGQRTAKVVVQGWDKGTVRRHGCPSHGVGLTPDEKEIWLCDGFNMRMHVFANKPPYQQLTTIPLRDMPGWITFSKDGKYAYPSSGEVIDTKTRKTLTFLTDENNNAVGSEKMIEVFMANNKATSIADQFGVGRIVK